MTDQTDVLNYAHSIAEKLARNGEQDDWAATLQRATARQWLRLMEQQNLYPEEVNALMAVLDRYDLGSAWYEMCLFSKRWKEIVLLSRQTCLYSLSC